MFVEHGETGVDDGGMIDFSWSDLNSVIFDNRKARSFWGEFNIW